jgi:uncharacterized membrane protein
MLLIFGLQWLRKAILRSSGLKALHDEDEIYRHEQEAALAAGHEVHYGLDWFAFVVAFKGVFLEGLEVVFIVVTLGLNGGSVPVAAAAATAAAVMVVAIGAIAHRPLANVPENTLKFTVGLALSTFGTFWVFEGLGVFAPGNQSLEWPGGEWSLLVLLVLWVVAARATVALLRRSLATTPAAVG